MTNMKAEKGDLIRIVEAFAENVKNGEIYEVVGVENYGVRVKMNGRYRSNYVADSEYVIHRKAGEEDSEDITTEMSDLLCDCCQKPLDADSYEGFCSKTCHHDYNGLSEEADVVNSPTHYTQGKFETIEIIEEITKGYSDGYVAYCVGNALKYLARAPFKHGEPSEDLSKAAKYLAFASEYLDAKSTQD